MSSQQQQQKAQDLKRPYSHLIVEPPEIIKTLRHLKTLVEKDDKADKNDLAGIKESLIHMQELIDDKIKQSKKRKENEAKRSAPSVFSDPILSKVMDFVDINDLPSYRFVNRQWNTIASEKIRAKKIIKFKSFQYKRTNSELTATGFLREIRRSSKLFASTRFEITLGWFATYFQQFLALHASTIKYLHLIHDVSNNQGYCYHQLADFNQVFTFNGLQNCEHMKLTKFPCSDGLLKFPLDIPQHPNMKVLEISIDYRGQKANYFGITSYYAKLLKSCSLIKSLEIIIQYDCKMESGDILQNIIESINCAELKQLQQLSLNWNDFNNKNEPTVGQLDFTQLLPSCFQLKGLKLHNISCNSIKPFLQYHRKSLEELKVYFSPKLSKNSTTDFTADCLSELNLKILSIPAGITDNEATRLTQKIMDDDLTNLQKLRITEFSHKFYKSTPGFNTTVQTLKLELNNPQLHLHTAGNILNMLDAFPCVTNLTIKYAEQSILKNIWKASVRSTLKVFSMCHPSRYVSPYPNYYVYDLDSVITGFSVEDCKRILTNKINKATFFDLNYFNMDEWKKSCRKITLPDHYEEHISVACLENLQKLEISYCKGNITEVSMIYILVSLKKLTSLTIQHSSIRKYFVTNLRKSLDLSFHLDVDCVD